MKNILFFDCSLNISGAELSLSDLVRKLDKTLFKIYFVTNNKKLIQKINNPEICVNYLKMVWMKKTRNPFALLNYFLQCIYVSFWLYWFAKKNIHIICFNTVKSFIYTYLAGYLLKTKQVIFVRDNIYGSIPSQFVLKKADYIVPVSEFINKQIKDSSKKKVVYGGIDCLYWNPKNPGKNLKTELGLEHDTAILAQIGQITQWKNHIDFIKAACIIAQGFKNAHFLIIGDCLSKKDFSYKKDILKEVGCLGLADKVTFLGFRDDIREVITQVDILIHPAINEPFGRVIIEAMAMKKPIIAYNCGGPREIVKNKQTGFLVNPSDYQSLAGKTVDLLNNTTLQKQFGEAGRKMVKKGFDIHDQIKKIEKIFADI